MSSVETFVRTHYDESDFTKRGQKQKIPRFACLDLKIIMYFYIQKMDPVYSRASGSVRLYSCALS